MGSPLVRDDGADRLKLERRVLQGFVAVLALIPIGAGLAGALLGITPLTGAAFGGRDLDSHGRYLSGLLLAIGLGFWSTIPAIERRTARFKLLASLVVVGGLARLVSVFAAGWPSPVMITALAMELLVTPALAIWQRRVARLAL
jgi:Domain of unknown function (DUF4345)